MPELRGLYAITRDEPDRQRLLTEVGAALAGGCRWLQYRDKISAPPERHQRAQLLADLCRQHQAALIINDDVALARSVAAAGVHLGREDGDIASARRQLGPDAVIGASCYNDFALARQATAAGADYIAFGAVFTSSVKPHAANAPLELFGRARAELGIPVCAIGGLTLSNAGSVIAAGASLLAVITDLFEAPDIAGRATAFQQLFEECPA